MHLSKDSTSSRHSSVTARGTLPAPTGTSVASADRPSPTQPRSTRPVAPASLPESTPYRRCDSNPVDPSSGRRPNDDKDAPGKLCRQRLGGGRRGRRGGRGDGRRRVARASRRVSHDDHGRGRVVERRARGRPECRGAFIIRFDLPSPYLLHRAFRDPVGNRFSCSCVPSESCSAGRGQPLSPHGRPDPSHRCDPATADAFCALPDRPPLPLSLRHPRGVVGLCLGPPARAARHPPQPSQHVSPPAPKPEKGGQVVRAHVIDHTLPARHVQAARPRAAHGRQELPGAGQARRQRAADARVGRRHRRDEVGACVRAHRAAQERQAVELPPTKEAAHGRRPEGALGPRP